MLWIKRLNKSAFRMAVLSAKLSFKKESPNVSFGAVMYGRPRCCKGKSDLKRR